MSESDRHTDSDRLQRGRTNNVVYTALLYLPKLPLQAVNAIIELTFVTSLRGKANVPGT